MGDVIAHYELTLGLRGTRGKTTLGVLRGNNGNIERAVKHLIISATQGFDLSIKAIMEEFKQGHVSKEDLATALRAHKAAVDATKSPQREEAERVMSMSNSVKR